MASIAAQLPSTHSCLIVLAIAGLSCSRAKENSPADPIGGNLPAQTFPDFPSCTHPAVERECSNGWCRIPPGCFIMGSPSTEWGRGAFSEEQVAVTLTRPFLMQEHELTQAQWIALGVPNPSGHFADGTGDCLERECPVGSMNWFEAAAFANLYSQRHEPPLSSCYRLVGCTGELGHEMRCSGFELTTPTVYECEGFRLPTEAEWEYAARAGTRTAFYSGDIAPQQTNGDCFNEPNLEALAWYCHNSHRLTHPVKQKRPNGWGLFDILGNVFEWTHDTQSGETPPGPLVDPGGTDEQYTGRLQRGGSYLVWSSLLRAASGSNERSWDFVIKGEGVGVRLVRTLRE